MELPPVGIEPKTSCHLLRCLANCVMLSFGFQSELTKCMRSCRWEKLILNNNSQTLCHWHPDSQCSSTINIPGESTRYWYSTESDYTSVFYLIFHRQLFRYFISAAQTALDAVVATVLLHKVFTVAKLYTYLLFYCH